MPAPHAGALDLRPVTIDDIVIVADLDATRDPEDPRDAEMMRYWWTSGSLNQVSSRLVAVHEGKALAFMAATHERWGDGPERFGSLRVVIRSDVWSDREYAQLVDKGEAWLASEGVATPGTRVSGAFPTRLEAPGGNEFRRGL